MPKLVAQNAQMMCNFGSSPAQLSLTAGRAAGDRQTLATVFDNLPFANVSSFGLCSSLSNPTVASATSGTIPFGVLKPQPCVPAVASPWSPGASRVQLGAKPALLENCTLNCIWGGAIQIKQAGQNHSQGQ